MSRLWCLSVHGRICHRGLGLGLGRIRGRIIAGAVLIGIIYAEFSSHNFEIVEVANGRRCGICVGELCEAKTLWATSLLVVHKAEVVDLARATERLDD